MNQQFWDILPKRSSLQFRVSYLQISNINGSFSKLSGKVVTDEALRYPVVELLIEARSIETFDPRRNAKLRSEQFLFAERYPYLSFASSDGCRSGMIKEVTGELTVREKRQAITLLVNFSEQRVYRKKPAVLFRLFGTVSRSAMGLGDAEGEIGDEIHLNAEIFLVSAGEG
jgi:polyisoprenoid-binding protein YceI